MRRAATFLGVTILGVSSFAVLTPSASGDDLDGDQFRLTARTWTEHYEDVGRKGESLGDTLTFTDKLFHAGERVGSDAVTCQVTKASERSFRLLCWGTLSIRGRGDLTLHGMVGFREGSTAAPVLAVTGGTGSYTGASGTMTLDERRRSSRYHIQLVP